ncbi:MAG: ATP-binding protein [Bacteroidetes bacterium]|nr:MAG: ATP-binding protein [Bacteroidota bacterium]
MRLRDVVNLVEEGEGFELEFKRKVSSPEKIARTLSAFANTGGGIILFGVDDDGSLVGVDSEKTEADLLRHAADHHCDPPVPISVEYVPYHHRDIIVVSVEESGEKPHFVVNDGEEDRAYIRVKDTTVIASREVVKVLRDERAERGLTVSIGENEKRLFAYLETHDRITVKEFASAVNVSERRASRILTTLVRAGVIRIHTLEKTDYFTLASPAEGSAPRRTSPRHTPPRR